MERKQHEAVAEERRLGAEKLAEAERKNAKLTQHEQEVNARLRDTFMQLSTQALAGALPVRGGAASILGPVHVPPPTTTLAVVAAPGTAPAVVGLPMRAAFVLFLSGHAKRVQTGLTMMRRDLGPEQAQELEDIYDYMTDPKDPLSREMIIEMLEVPTLSRTLML